MSARWPDDELFYEVLVAPRRSFVPHHDTQIIERPGWMQLITPSFRQGGMNEIAYSALLPAEADAVIDETLMQYQRLGLRFRWSVPPGSQPADLAERLGRRGLKASDVLAMYRLVETPDALPAPPPGITIEEVDHDTLDEFTQVTAAGWDMDPAPLGGYHRQVLDDPERRGRLFLLRCDGVPAATANLMRFTRSVYFSGAVVLPAFRGRGAYRALVATRMRLAGENGISLATTQARADSSAPILATLGFRTLCRYPVFTNY